jgi:murein DD-endopeptidase MepM/ murein hydrolase activator NlpD
MNLEIRNDPAGRGTYQASRGARKHKGSDYLALPGEPVYSPISGKVVRTVRAYADTSKYTGIVVQGKQVRLKMLYLQPIAEVGEYVGRGDQVGIAQDVSERYPNQGMKAHIHYEVEHMDIELLLPVLEIIEKGDQS